VLLEYTFNHPRTTSEIMESLQKSCQNINVVFWVRKPCSNLIGVANIAEGHCFHLQGKSRVNIN
jgi:hypothetical protein